MNYIKEIVAFNEWKEVNQLPATAIALWYELMAINNKCGWQQEFTVPNGLLQIKAGLSRKQFDAARLLLIQKGRINYKKSNNVNQAGKYSMIPFVQKGQQEGQQEVHQEGAQKEHRRDNERGTLFKQNKTKQNNKKNKDQPSGGSSEYTELFEKFWSSYPRKVGKKRAFSLWKERIKKKQATADQLIKAATNYSDHCKAKSVEKEYIKHPSTFLSAKEDYADWIDYKPEPKLSVIPGGQSSVDQRGQNDLDYLNTLMGMGGN